MHLFLSLLGCLALLFAVVTPAAVSKRDNSAEEIWLGYCDDGSNDMAYFVNHGANSDSDDVSPFSVVPDWANWNSYSSFFPSGFGFQFSVQNLNAPAGQFAGNGTGSSGLGNFFCYKANPAVDSYTINSGSVNCHGEYICSHQPPDDARTTVTVSGDVVNIIGYDDGASGVLGMVSASIRSTDCNTTSVPIGSTDCTIMFE